MIQSESRKSRYRKMSEGLQQLRSPHEQFWQDADSYILPGAYFFSPTDAVQRAAQRNDEFILDETCTLAARTGASGFMAGMTSPARPWVRVSMEDDDIAELFYWWCDDVSAKILEALQKSNTYDVLASVYEHEFVFGQSPMYIEEDMATVLHAWTFPPGSYWIGTDAKGKVNVFRRDYQLTVRQVVDEFGRPDGPHRPIDWTNISMTVKQAWETGNTEMMIDITNIICPNDEYDRDRLASKYKAYRSCTWEGTSTGGTMSASGQMGGVDEDGKFLRERGYDYFPVLCPRWSVTGTGPYATNCPGKTAMGSVKQLQMLHKLKARAIQVMVDPPLNAPGSMRTRVVTSIPGTVNFVDNMSASNKVEPVYQIEPKVSEIRQEISATQQMIRRTFFEDLFLLMINDPRSQPPTAEEVRVREQEKLLAVGPVLERNDHDLYAPLIEMVFMFLERQGKLPAIHSMLAGKNLKIEYLSLLAQAQKAAGLGGMDRVLGTVARVASVKPEVLDIFDADEFMRIYGDRSSAPSKLFLPPEKVAAIRQAKAQAMQAQRMQQAIPAAADTAKTLSETNMDGNNALNQLVNTAKAGQLVQSP